MQPRDDNRTAFLRWRDAGDLAALTEVFDSVAQELLLIASHVATAGQQPEDLLQQTFLTAIQKADRYDGSRPLEPWLLGILVNFARSSRRQLQRERSGLDVDSDFVLADPAAAVAADELANHVREVIESLPLPQREVMTLHLVHGMTPTEIAHATARPVGTVKSWIHRSLEHVRSRLPAGLVAPFGMLLRGMSRLSNVRQVVLAAAGTATTAAVSTTTAGTATARAPGWRFARHAPWLGGAAIALLGGTSWLLSGGDAPVPAPTPPVAALPAASAAAAPTTAAGEAAPADAARVAAPPAAATAVLTIVGKPDADPFAFTGYVLIPHLPDADLQRGTFTTDERGVYSVRGVPFGIYVLQPDRTDSFPITIDRAEVTVEVPIARGHDVRGRVVDANGRGVGDASVWLTSAALAEDRLQVATTDPTGAFVVHCVPAGRHLAAEHAGFLPSRLVAIAATNPSDAVDVELRLDEAATTIAFEVVEPNGAPVADAMLQLGHCLPRASSAAAKLGELRPPWRGRTDGDGRVVCTVAHTGVPTTLFARSPRTIGVESTVVANPGAPPQRVVLPRGGCVRGQLHEPAAAPRIVIARALGPGLTAGPTTPLWCLPSCATTTNGSYTLSGIPAGRATVRLGAGNDVAERTFDVRDGETIEWSPRLSASGKLTGRIDGIDAELAAGLRVRLRGAAMQSLDADLAADGSFHFDSVPTRDYELVLLPRAPGADFVLHRHYPVRSGDEVRLSSPPETAQLGSVRGIAADASVRLVTLSNARGRYSVAAGDDGRFSFASLPADTYHLVAGRTSPRWYRELQLGTRATIDVGVITPEPTTTVTLTVAEADVSERAPLEVHVRTTDATTMVSFARHRGPPLPLELPRGRWQLELWRQACCIATTVVEVAGEPLAVAMRPARGETVLLSAAPAVPTLALPVIWTITGPAGRRRFFSHRPDSHEAHRPAGLRIVLPLGDHEVAASTGGGPPTTMRFVVPLDPGRRLPPLLLH